MHLNASGKTAMLRNQLLLGKLILMLHLPYWIRRITWIGLRNENTVRSYNVILDISFINDFADR